MRLLVSHSDAARFQQDITEMSDGKLKPVEEGRVWAAQAEGTWYYFDPPAGKIIIFLLDRKRALR